MKIRSFSMKQIKKILENKIMFIIFVAILIFTIAFMCKQIKNKLIEKRQIESLAKYKELSQQSQNNEVKSNKQVKTKEEEQKIVKNIDIGSTMKKENGVQDKINRLEEYINLPREIKGQKVIGKIEIEKLNISKYILEETNEKSLKAGVTKICGPEINKVGNFCISGHNYAQTFGKLKNLEIGDTIVITDTYDRKGIYHVTEVIKVDPNDTTCLTQDTDGQKEITLVTCTTGAIKRVIIKAVQTIE